MRAATPPATPKRRRPAVRAVPSRDVGMRNIGSAPQNQRATTTLEMADSTIEPRTAALHRPITSSTTNRMAEMGALNAAANPAAAPIGANMRSRSRER